MTLRVCGMHCNTWIFLNGGGLVLVSPLVCLLRSFSTVDNVARQLSSWSLVMMTSLTSLTAFPPPLSVIT